MYIVDIRGKLIGRLSENNITHAQFIYTEEALKKLEIRLEISCPRTMRNEYVLSKINEVKRIKRI